MYAKDHRLYHTGTGQWFDFGEVVDAAADIAVPTGDAAPKLKDKSQWKYIGRDMPVVDNYDMSTGGATYGADISVPGMKIAVVARSPVYRGKVKSFDASETLKVQGVEQVIEIPALPDDKPAEFHALGGVAVIGTNTWSVMEGRDRLVIEWDGGPNVKHDSSTYNDELMASARAGGHVVRDRGNVDEALGSAAQVLEAEYFVPYFIHTPMEPPVAIGRRNPDAGQGRDLDPGAQLGPAVRGGGAGHRADRCRVRGDAAGRRLRPQVQAGLRVRGGDPFQQDRRPGAGAVDPRGRDPAGLLPLRERPQAQGGAGRFAGKVTAWHHSGAWPTLIALWAPQMRTGHPLEYGLGLIDTPYNQVPNLRIENGEIDAMIRVGWYRSVNNIQHAFAMNCFANELAEAAGRDPVEFLLELIGDADVMDLTQDGVPEHWNYGDSIEDWPIMPKRLSNVLRVVAEKSGYGKSHAARSRPRHRVSPQLPQLRGNVRSARRGPRRRLAPHPAGGHGDRLRPLRQSRGRAEADGRARPSTATRSRCTARSPPPRGRSIRATSTTTRSPAWRMRRSTCARTSSRTSRT